MAVFPLKPKSKLPATRHGCLDATKDLETVGGWWEGGPALNIGIATGAPSGIWVLDIDGDAGEASWRRIEQEYGTKLPATAEVLTGSGGRHIYFQLPDFKGAPGIRNSAGQVAPGIDVRGTGGYVVAPPSVHPNGKPYAWLDESSIAEAPVWLVELVTRVNVADLDRRRSDDHWTKILHNGAVEGTRNQTAASLAGHFLRAGASAVETFELLWTWNQCRNRPPMTEAELSSVVASIARREWARRGYSE
jgi:hypothetical protein